MTWRLLPAKDYLEPSEWELGGSFSLSRASLKSAAAWIVSANLALRPASRQLAPVRSATIPDRSCRPHGFAKFSNSPMRDHCGPKATVPHCLVIVDAISVQWWIESLEASALASIP